MRRFPELESVFAESEFGDGNDASLDEAHSGINRSSPSSARSTRTLGERRINIPGLLAKGTPSTVSSSGSLKRKHAMLENLSDATVGGQSAPMGQLAAFALSVQQVLPTTTRKDEVTPKRIRKVASRKKADDDDEPDLKS